MVVQRDHPERAGRRFLEAGGRGRQVHVLECPALLAPGSNRVEAYNDDSVAGVLGLGGAEDAFPLRKRARETCRNRVRDVVIPRYRQERQPEPLQELRCCLELRATTAVGQVACCDEQLGPQVSDQLTERAQRLPCLPVTHVQVGEVENARGHGRGRLYTRNVANESPELFDDVYLGLRAGGAVRKQRRGEPLSADEAEAIGHWRRLSLWRKFIAIGAFTLGTFGLGLTVGGLIFGRRARKA